MILNKNYFYKCQFVFALPISHSLSTKNNFTELKCRTEYFKNSYFPRVVTKWNSLDSDLKTIDSFSIFKSRPYKKFYSEINDYEPPHK